MFRALLAALLLSTLAACGGGRSCTLDDDGNACTVEACRDGATVHTPAALGSPCSAGGTLCDGHGVCIAASCGEGVVNGSELCDDGNLWDGDGCDSNCTPTGCGNGIVTAGEECDDGNRTGSDGCDATCHEEPSALAFAYVPPSLVRGQARALVLTGTFKGGTRDVTSKAGWTSSAPAVLTVGAGEVHALAGGDATVTAKLGAATAQVALHVHAERIAFVTSAAGPGNLAAWAGSSTAGLAGADAVCGRLATAAGLSGTYRAWLSDDAHDAYCRAHGLLGKVDQSCGLAALPASAGPWIRTDGLPFAAGIAALVGGHVLYPARFDELGRKAEEAALYYTATGADGALRVAAAAGTCGNWSGGAGATVWGGGVASGPEGWTELQLLFCNDGGRLLCLEIGAGPGPALEPFAVPGKRVFATSVHGKGDLSAWAGAGGASGLAAGDAICASRAAAAGLAGTYRAFLGDATHLPVDRVTGAGPWVRVDGVRVAATRAELGASLVASVSVDELGGVAKGPFWSGGLTEQGLRSSCGGWSSSAAGVVGVYGLTSSSTPEWSALFEASCGELLPIVCFEE
ncbi:MAG: DUF4215 domain-containing protein [Anaeromyxobacter sp.]